MIKGIINETGNSQIDTTVTVFCKEYNSNRQINILPVDYHQSLIKIATTFVYTRPSVFQLVSVA